MRKENFDELLQYASRHKKSVNLKIHVALLMRGKRIIAMAKNRVGTRTSGSGFNAQTIHAEVAVIKKLGDISRLRGLTLVVLRYGFEFKSWTQSHPCPDCQKFLNKCMDKYGLHKVYYSTNDSSKPHYGTSTNSCRQHKAS